MSLHGDPSPTMINKPIKTESASSSATQHGVKMLDLFVLIVRFENIKQTIMHQLMNIIHKMWFQKLKAPVEISLT